MWGVIQESWERDTWKENDVGNSHSNPIARDDTCTFRHGPLRRVRKDAARGLGGAARIGSERLKLGTSCYVTWFC